MNWAWLWPATNKVGCCFASGMKVQLDHFVFHSVSQQLKVRAAIRGSSFLQVFRVFDGSSFKSVTETDRCGDWHWCWSWNWAHPVSLCFLLPDDHRTCPQRQRAQKVTESHRKERFSDTHPPPLIIKGKNVVQSGLGIMLIKAYCLLYLA